MHGRRVWGRSVVIVAIACGFVAGLMPAPGGADPFGQVTEIPVTTASSSPDHIVAGPDGAMWFTENANQIGRITLGGTITEFGPTAANPEEIVVGPDGNLWFTSGDTEGNGAIGRITPAGVITEFGTSTITFIPEGLALGPDKMLWFTEHTDSGEGLIGRIDPLAVDPNTTIVEFPIGASGTNAHPNGITAGSDGNMWFTRDTTDLPNGVTKVSRILTASPNTITEFALTDGSNPEGITSGPDGNLWFVESFNSGTPRIGRMDPRAVDPATTLTEFTAGLTNHASPDGIASGCDGNLWFTEDAGAGGAPPAIGRITLAGVITEYPVPTAGSFPAGISASVPGDPNMWFGEADANNIGRISACPAPVLVARFTG